MDVRQLKHFVGVATHGSFANAARVLNISQPALTRSVRLLEDQLGVTLLERSHKGIEVTARGQTLYNHAILVINSLDNVKAELASAKDSEYGEIKVGIASLFANFLVDKAITNVSISDPHFKAMVRVGLWDELNDMLKEGRLDFVVSMNLEIDAGPEIRFEGLCEMSSILVAGSENHLSKQSVVTMEDLQHAKWVTLKESLMDSFLVSFFAQASLVAPKTTVRTTSLEMLRSLIRHQHFIGFLPSHWVSEDIKMGRLTIIDVPGTPVFRTAGVVTRKASILNPGAERLISELRAVSRAA